MPREDFLVTTDWLAGHLGDPGIRIVDTRYYLREVLDVDERTRFLEGHIPGAVHVHWIDDVSDPDDPARGQIAPPERFAEAMARHGIGDDTLVIAYDDNHIALAARLRWALRYHGHDRVRLLDGGLNKWVAEGRPLESGPQQPAERATFTPHVRPEYRITKDEVLDRLGDGRTRLFDCRFDTTWNAAGAHIPGAQRLPAVSFLAADGTWLQEQEIRGRIAAAGLDDARDVVTYCGAGIAATGTLMALEMAGLEGARMYDGSWDEWARDDAAPRERHDAPQAQPG